MEPRRAAPILNVSDLAVAVSDFVFRDPAGNVVTVPSHRRSSGLVNDELN